MLLPRPTTVNWANAGTCNLCHEFLRHVRTCQDWLQTHPTHWTTTTIPIRILFEQTTYITRLASNEIFSPSNKIHREVEWAKDLSAPLYYDCRECVVGWFAARLTVPRALVFQVVSFPQVFLPKPRIYLSPIRAKCSAHLILLDLVRSTDHKAPGYVVFSTPLLPRPW